MLIREIELKRERALIIRESQVYGLLRRTQKRILERGFRKLSEFSQRDTFHRFAQRLTRRFFPEAVKKDLVMVEYVERAYVDWLILAPLLASYKWIPKPGMHRGHYLTWARRNCNKRTRQYFFARIEFPLPDMDSMAERAVKNACELLKLKDEEWLREEFGFLSWLSTTDGLKARLARWILLPWVFLDEDFRLDDLLFHSIPGWNKEVARAGKKGSASYFRLGNEAWVFASERMTEKVDLPWVDLRKEKARALDYLFWFEKTLQIGLSEEVMTEAKTEIKAIANHKGINPHYRLYLLNRFAKDFILKHKHAVSAGPQFKTLGAILKRFVKRKIAAVLGAEYVSKGIYPGYGDIDRSLYFRKLNPFFDVREPGEEEFQAWWSPFQP